MIIRVAAWTLRIAGLLALILGLIIWFNLVQVNLRDIHMLLGILVTLSLWILGGIMFTRKGGAGLGTTAIILGIILVAVGLGQLQVTDYTGRQVIRVIHLLLGLSALGLGESISARYRRTVEKSKLA